MHRLINTPTGQIIAKGHGQAARQRQLARLVKLALQGRGPMAGAKAGIAQRHQPRAQRAKHRL